MEFPSLEFAKVLQDKLNGKHAFNVASRWSDVKVLLCLGDKRYWMKLYGGKVIDVMEYLPMANALGWDFSINGTVEAWQDLIQGKKGIASLYGIYITVDGNMIEANRMHEAIQLIIETVPEVMK